MMIDKIATTFKHLSKEERQDFFKYKIHNLQDQIKLDILNYKKKIEQKNNIKFNSIDEFKNYIYKSANNKEDVYIVSLFNFVNTLNDFFSFIDFFNNKLNSLFIKHVSEKSNEISDIINNILSMFSSNTMKNFDKILEEYDPQFSKSLNSEKIKDIISNIKNFISKFSIIPEIKLIVEDILKINNEINIKSDEILDQNFKKDKFKELSEKYLSYDFIYEHEDFQKGDINSIFLLLNNLKLDLEKIKDNIARFAKEEILGDEDSFSFKKLTSIIEESKVFEKYKVIDNKIVSKICTLLSKNTSETQFILRFMQIDLLAVFDVFYEIYEKSKFEIINKGNLATIFYKILFYSAKLINTFNSEVHTVLNVLAGSKDDIIKKINSAKKTSNFLDFIIGYFEQMKERFDLAHIYINNDKFDNIMFDSIALKIDSSVARECYKSYFAFLSIMDPVITVDIRDDSDIANVLEIINLEIDIIENKYNSSKIENKFAELTNGLYDHRNDFLQDFKKIVSFLRNPKLSINVLGGNLSIIRKLSSASSIIKGKRSLSYDSYMAGLNSVDKFTQLELKDVYEITKDKKYSEFENEDIASLKKHPTLYKLDNINLGNNIVAKVLSPQSAKYFTVGIETNCCQAAGLAGENAMIDSYINPLAGILILEYNNNLISQSYFHLVPILEKNEALSNGIILDNVETINNLPISNEMLDRAYNKLALIATKELGFKYFICGTRFNKLTNSAFSFGKLKTDPRYFAVEDPYTDFGPGNQNIDLTSYNKKIQLQKSDELETEEENARGLKKTPLTYNLREKF